MQEIYYATSNSVKFKEAEDFFKKNLPNIKLLQCTKDFDEIQTMDQKAIALDKALQAWNFLKKPVLVDDAGIYFDKYNEFPGTLTKFIYKGIGLAGIFKLISNNEKASFKLNLVFLRNPDDYKIFQAACHGKIIHPATLTDFNESAPFDLIFVPENQELTFHELRKIGTMENYNYRTFALKQFAEWFEKNNI